MATQESTTNFAALLQSALTEPGIVSQAYAAFHNYSMGNQFLALSQCAARGIAVGPIATFPGWKDKGRFVRKGEKAIELCMPVTGKRKGETDDDPDVNFTRFVFRRNWFVLSQTDGDDYVLPELPEWTKARALESLEITETAFEHPDGNCQGYARQRCVAVSPVAEHPFKTLVHELAHVVIGHTAEGEMSDNDRTPRDIRELEAESVAMLVCAALNQPGVEHSRGYIQAWYKAETMPEASARRILKTADAILKAGRPAVAKE
jgi:antirestriction protein ArdC